MKGACVMLNEALKLARQFHRMSLSELAEKMEISKSYLSEIENNHKNVTLELLNRYSKALNIPVSHLMLFAESMNEKNPLDKVRRAVAGKALSMLRWVEEITHDEQAAEKEKV
jgi:transcriptional regulator with XRE-family HTH domain